MEPHAGARPTRTKTLLGPAGTAPHPDGSGARGGPAGPPAPPQTLAQFAGTLPAAGGVPWFPNCTMRVGVKFMLSMAART